MLLTFLNALVALTLGAPVLVAATVADAKPQLCEVLKGKYDPAAPDQCAGGDWVRIVPVLREAAPQPQPAKK